MQAAHQYNQAINIVNIFGKIKHPIKKNLWF